MTAVRKKNSLGWLHELVESAKKWRATFPTEDIKHLHPTLRAMAEAVDGYEQTIESEIKTELDAEEKGTT